MFFKSFQGCFQEFPRMFSRVSKDDLTVTEVRRNVSTATNTHKNFAKFAVFARLVLESTTKIFVCTN